MARILVAGGAGFLGSHLCEKLLSDGHQVFCLDNFSSGRRENIANFEGNGSFEVVESDVQDPGELPEVDRIYHLASRASPKDFTNHPIDIALANTQGTKVLLEHALENGARLLFASTSEVYGDPEVHPQTEDYNGNVDIQGIRGCYDESKRFGETLISAYKREHGLDARIARIFNTYGPRMRPDDGRVVPNFLTQALQGEDLTVYGDGEQTRSFCYMDDMIEGLTSLMRAESLKHQVFNLGRENERTINDLAQVVLELVDSESEIVYESLPEDDPKKRQPDISRAREELDWEPKTDLKTGLRATIAYMEEGLGE